MPLKCPGTFSAPIRHIIAVLAVHTQFVTFSLLSVFGLELSVVCENDGVCFQRQGNVEMDFCHKGACCYTEKMFFFFRTILLPVLCNCGFSFTFYIYSLILLQQSTRWQDTKNKIKLNLFSSSAKFITFFPPWTSILLHILILEKILETKMDLICYWPCVFFLLDFHNVTYFGKFGIYWILKKCISMTGGQMEGGEKSLKKG